MRRRFSLSPFLRGFAFGRSADEEHLVVPRKRPPRVAAEVLDPVRRRADALHRGDEVRRVLARLLLLVVDGVETLTHVEQVVARALEVGERLAEFAGAVGLRRLDARGL